MANFMESATDREVAAAPILTDTNISSYPHYHHKQRSSNTAPNNQINLISINISFERNLSLEATQCVHVPLVVFNIEPPI